MVRKIVLDADKKIEETIKWGNLAFIKNRKNIAFVYTYDKAPYINFGFLKATSLKDPNGLFQGTGKGMRHVKIVFREGYRQKSIYCLVERSGAIRRSRYIAYKRGGYMQYTYTLATF